MDENSVAVAEPVVRVDRKAHQKPKRQPRYHVILWDDNDHSYEYVILMMHQIFGHQLEQAFQLAKEVDRSGRAICLTTTKELAELKCEQISAFGPDSLIPRCQGSMTASIEPESSE